MSNIIRALFSFYFRSVRSSSPSEASDRFRNGEPVTPSDFSLQHPGFLPSHPNVRSPPPHAPPRYPHPPALHSPSDGPLNLSISNSSTGEKSSGIHSPSQSRPSVITCATPADRRYELGSNGSCSPSRKDTGNYLKYKLGFKSKFVIFRSQQYFREEKKTQRL